MTAVAAEWSEEWWMAGVMRGVVVGGSLAGVSRGSVEEDREEVRVEEVLGMEALHT